MPKHDLLLLAYLAGAVDCDGSIQVQFNRKRLKRDGTFSHYYMVKVGLTQVDRTLPDLMLATFGGAVYRYDDPKRGGNGYWHNWTTGSSGPSRSCLEALLPYLRQKGAQAQAALDLIEVMARRRAGGGSRPLTYEERDERFRLMQSVRRHNARGAAGNNQRILAAESLADYERGQDALNGKKVPTPELDGRTWTEFPVA